MFGRKKRENSEPSPDAPANTYNDLRAMALDAVTRGLASSSPEHPDVAGLVADIPASGGFVTIVGLADGTSSMYTSVGGGVIGAGTHAAVASATNAALVEVQRNLDKFASRDDHALPPEGFVRLHVLTSSASRRADVPESAFWRRESHELMPVIATVQNLISALSAASPPGA